MKELSVQVPAIFMSIPMIYLLQEAALFVLESPLKDNPDLHVQKFLAELKECTDLVTQALAKHAAQGNPHSKLN